MPDATSTETQLAEIRDRAVALRQDLVGIDVPRSAALVREDCDVAAHHLSVAAVKLSNALVTGLPGARS